MPLLLLALATFLVACGGGSEGLSPDAPIATPDSAPPDSPPLPDAPPADAGLDARPVDLSCVGGPDAGAVPAMITISGRVRQGLLNMTNSQNVLVEILPAATEAPPAIVSTTTGSDGRFSLVIPTNGMPVDGVGRFSKDGFITEWFYPAEPLAQSFAGLEGLMGRTSDFDNPLIGLVFGTSYDPQKGLAAILVLDCAGDPIEGATVTLAPPAEKMLYADGNGFPSAVQSTTSRTGAVFGWNMPVGPITIGGRVGTTDLATHIFKTHQGEISLTLLTP